MRFFTKSLLTLTLLVAGAVSASAEKIYADFTSATATGNSSWSANTFSWTASTYAFMAIPGDAFKGDLSSCTKIGFTVANLSGEFRVDILANVGGTEKTYTGKSIATNGDIVLTILEDFNERWTPNLITVENLASVNAIRLNTNSNAGSAVITDFYIERADDPLAAQKTALQKAIDVAEIQNPNFKTSLSWSKLQDAITNAKAAKNKADVTEEELVNAKEAVNNAINGLELFQGYTKLTKDAFKKYTSITEPGEGTATGCAYDINVSTGMPYGDSNVGELNWADLADYDKLVVIAAAGTPRMLFNRDVANGQWNETEAESHLLESTKNGWSSKYFTKDETIFTVDVKQILKDKGFVRLHSIKGFNGNVTVTDMLLFKAPASTTDDPAVVVNLMSLQNAIDKANAIDLTTKTKESAKKVKNAVLAAQDLMAQSNPSLIDLENARRAILQAIDELVDAPVIADGVYDLKSDMFQEWTGIDETAEPTENPIGCAYEVGTGDKGAGTTMFGNPSVVWKTYADLSAYDHLLIVGTPGLQLRVLFNRLEVGNGGGDGNGGALTELNPTIGEDGLVDVDLKAENLNGAARLNAIKLGWGSPAGQFTKLQVVKGAYDPVVVGVNTVKAAAERDAIYSISGQRLAQPKKGLNIINGKKVVIK